jgi:mRNA interferase HigB
MHIVSRRALREAAKIYSGVEPGLETWFRVASKAQWLSLDDVRKTYPAADAIKVGSRVYTVFNIGGNNFRLIVKIEYTYKKIFIKHVLTHAEYDKDYWKK